MLKKLDNLDKRYSKKIFKLEFPTLINLIFYGFSILYMEETVFFTIASFYYFIIKNLRLTVYYILVLGLNVFVTVFMKRIFNRTRPSDKELSKSNKTTFFRKKQCNGSLPSGDTLQGFAFSAFSWFYLSREVFILSFLTAILVGFSRIYLCCHYIGDVITGALVGLFLTYLVVILVLENKNLNWIWNFLDN